MSNVSTETTEPTDAAALAGEYLADDVLKRCPYDRLNTIRDEAPVVQTPAGPWLVSSQALAAQVLRDDRFSRSQAAASTIANFLDPGPARDIWLSKIVSSDGERHHRLRNVVNKAFTPRAVERWRPEIERVAQELLDGMREAGSADVVESFAYPLPEHVICDLLGAGAADHRLFEAWTERIQNRSAAGSSASAVRAAAAGAILEFTGYLDGLVQAHEARGADPDGDLLSRLVWAAQSDGAVLTRPELVTIAMELIIGGHDTTANVITTGVLELCRRPQVYEALRAGSITPSQFVEELLRSRSPVQLSLTRVATEDLELGGHEVRAGDVVLVSLAAANRDPSHISDPDVFEPARPAVNHLAFGVGSHYCLGANLARAEAEIAFAALVRTFPAIRLAEPENGLPWREGSLVVAPSRLPIAW